MTQSRAHECAVPSCGMKISRRRLMCGPHLVLVPEALVRRIESAARAVVDLGPRPAHQTAEDAAERIETMQNFVRLRDEAIEIAVRTRA